MNVVRILGAACALALGATACGGGDKDRDYVSGGTYAEALNADPGNLHPLRPAQPTARRVIPFAYDTLVNLDDKGNVVGQLAERWEASPKRVTYTLRRGVTCSDGTKLTASDVADNFEWIKDPKNQSPYVDEMLAGADFTVRADDTAGTVTVQLEQPYGFLLQGAGLVPIVCAKGLADPNSLVKATDGTGPFQLTEYVPDDHLTLKVRKDYRWGPNGASADVSGLPAKVVLKIITNETTAVNLLLSGELNAAELTGPDRARLDGQGMQKLSNLSGPTDLFFNERRGHPGADAEVRKALAMALDLDQLTKVVTSDAGQPARSLALQPPRPCRYDSVKGTLPARDLDAAKALLDEAGWTPGPGGTRAAGGQELAVSLAYDAGDPASAAGMELISQWWKELGVDVKLKGQATNTFVQTLFAGNAWDAAWLFVGIPFPNMFMPYATGPVSPTGQNFGAIENGDYGRLANQALRTTGAAGCELWRQAEQALFRDVDVVPGSANAADTFAKDSRAALGYAGIEPTSVRLLAK
jgi:peptide/nickel transport system substrate-binding protein